MTSNNLNRFKINRNSIGIFCIVVFVLYFVFYFAYWGITSYSIRDMASKLSESKKYQLNFGSVSTSGFLLTNTKIKNIVFTIKFENDKEIKFFIQQLDIKTIPFSRNYAIVINDEMVLITNNGNKKNNEEQQFRIQAPKNFTIQFNLTKDNKVKNIFATANKITLSDQDKIDVIDLLSVSFERYKLVFDDSIESVIKFNVDNIIETEKSKNSIKKYENNFETIITFSTKFSEENNSVISNTIDINKFVLNDITNNFGFEIDGSYDSNFVTKNTMMNFLLKVVNYNSMLKAINNKNHFMLIDTKVLSQIVEIFTLAPQNYRNTKFDKYYSIKYDRSQKSVTINNEPIEMLFKKNFLF